MIDTVPRSRLEAVEEELRIAKEITESIRKSVREEFAKTEMELLSLQNQIAAEKAKVERLKEEIEELKYPNPIDVSDVYN